MVNIYRLRLHARVDHMFCGSGPDPGIVSKGTVCTASSGWNIRRKLVHRRWSWGLVLVL